MGIMDVISIYDDIFFTSLMEEYYFNCHNKVTAIKEYGFTAETIDCKDVIEYDTLVEPNDNFIPPTEADLCIVKLNGGLGTSMGCTGPKCILKIDEENTFLDFILAENEHNDHTADK